MKSMKSTILALLITTSTIIFVGCGKSINSTINEKESEVKVETTQQKAQEPVVEEKQEQTFAELTGGKAEPKKMYEADKVTAIISCIATPQGDSNATIMGIVKNTSKETMNGYTLRFDFIKDGAVVHTFDKKFDEVLKPDEVSKGYYEHLDFPFSTFDYVEVMEVK